MLVPFVIDADGLSPDQAWTPTQQRACYNGLLDAWRRSGLLVHDGDSLHGSRLHQAIQALPQSVRPRWQELLERSPLLANPSWNGSVSAATLSDFSTVAQLALVDDVCAEVEFGLDENCDEEPQSVNGTDVYVCRLLAAGQAQAFQTATVLAGTHIEAGDTFQATWDSRFQVLAKAPIKLVSVVDRYAISQHIGCPQTHLSGLERFLRLLDNGAAGHRHVTIYSAWTAELSGNNKKTIDDIEAELRVVFSKLPSKNIKRVKVLMVPNTCFRDDGHDRFVRFGDYVWDIGLGLEIFDGAFSARRSSAGFKAGPAVGGYKIVEQDLARHADTKSTEIR
ncbi:hypothetical protein N4P55_24435 [Pseudomonas fluorescens]|uniref:hypothetical protein n=1 Tax=Pseudomonas fluorescens TaxID=294 RepID=UPI0021D03089|nr:hypothetical protein [Pseudomonas fluorescens]UXV18985.1 hypothetical protein N4P55_24435 [Pseudomonas fluorescens]